MSKRLNLMWTPLSRITIELNKLWLLLLYNLKSRLLEYEPLERKKEPFVAAVVVYGWSLKFMIFLLTTVWWLYDGEWVYDQTEFTTDRIENALCYVSNNYNSQFFCALEDILNYGIISYSHVSTYPAGRVTVSHSYHNKFKHNNNNLHDKKQEFVVWGKNLLP